MARATSSALKGWQLHIYVGKVQSTLISSYLIFRVLLSLLFKNSYIWPENSFCIFDWTRWLIALPNSIKKCLLPPVVDHVRYTYMHTKTGGLPLRLK